LVTGRNCRRQKCRPRQSDAGCARRRPTAKPKDAGSIPATSTSQEYRPLNRDSALISGLYRVKRHEKDTGLSALRCSTYRLFGAEPRHIGSSDPLFGLSRDISRDISRACAIGSFGWAGGKLKCESDFDSPSFRFGRQVGQGKASGLARTRSESGVPQRPLTNRCVLEITMRKAGPWPAYMRLLRAVRMSTSTGRFVATSLRDPGSACEVGTDGAPIDGSHSRSASGTIR